MTTEENKAIVRRFNEDYISRNNVAVADELLADDFVDRSLQLPGKEGVKGFFAMLHGGFSGLHVTIEDQVAEGDKVTTRKTFHGTHSGDFFGIPPTGRKASWGVTDILRLRDGQIVEHWAIVDQLGLMQQLGVIPQPEGAAG